MSDQSTSTRLFELLEQRVANPVLRVLLRTPLATVVGDRLVLLSYRGRRSGRRIRTPVMTVRDGGERVVTTSRSGVTWWHNFTDGHDAVLWVRGNEQPVTGRAVTEEAEVAAWLETMQSRGQDRLLGFFGLESDADSAAIEAAAADIVVVRFSPRSP